MENKQGFFIYSKPNCKYCVEVKKILEWLNICYDTHECNFETDAEKTEFLEYIKSKNKGKIWNTFPMVFNNGDFIGGYHETGIYLEKMNAFVDTDF